MKCFVFRQWFILLLKIKYENYEKTTTLNEKYPNLSHHRWALINLCFRNKVYFYKSIDINVKMVYEIYESVEILYKLYMIQIIKGIILKKKS